MYKYCYKKIEFFKSSLITAVSQFWFSNNLDFQVEGNILFPVGRALATYVKTPPLFQASRQK